MGSRPRMTRLTTLGRATPAPPSPTPPTTPRPRPARNLIKLSVAEARRLFNVRDQGKYAIQHALDWSIWRRSHQAEARRHHFRHHLRMQQVLAL